MNVLSFSETINYSEVVLVHGIAAQSSVPHELVLEDQTERLIGFDIREGNHRSRIAVWSVLPSQGTFLNGPA